MAILDKVSIQGQNVDGRVDKNGYQTNYGFGYGMHLKKL